MQRFIDRELCVTNGVSTCCTYCLDWQWLGLLIWCALRRCHGSMVAEGLLLHLCMFSSGMVCVCVLLKYEIFALNIQRCVVLFASLAPVPSCCCFSDSNFIMSLEIHSSLGITLELLSSSIARTHIIQNWSVIMAFAQQRKSFEIM